MSRAIIVAPLSLKSESVLGFIGEACELGYETVILKLVSDEAMARLNDFRFVIDESIPEIIDAYSNLAYRAVPRKVLFNLSVSRHKLGDLLDHSDLPLFVDYFHIDDEDPDFETLSKLNESGARIDLNLIQGGLFKLPSRLNAFYAIDAYADEIDDGFLAFLKFHESLLVSRNGGDGGFMEFLSERFHSPSIFVHDGDAFCLNLYGTSGFASLNERSPLISEKAFLDIAKRRLAAKRAKTPMCRHCELASDCVENGFFVHAADECLFSKIA